MKKQHDFATQKKRDVSSHAFLPLPVAAGASWLLRHGAPYSVWWWAGSLVGFIGIIFTLIAVSEIRAARGWTPWVVLPGLAVATILLALIASLR
jgi:hypothetical protein